MAPGLGAGHEVRAGDECSEGGATLTGPITASCFVYPSRGCRKAAVLGPTSCTAKGFACLSLPVGHPLPWWGGRDIRAVDNPLRGVEAAWGTRVHS